jgi:hypothetical protein
MVQLEKCSSPTEGEVVDKGKEHLFPVAENMLLKYDGLGVGWGAQVVECWPNKCQALSFVSQYYRKKYGALKMT